MPFGGLLTAAIGGIGSILGGTTASRTSTQTQTPTFTPAQGNVQGTLGATIEQNLQNPGAQLDPLEATAAGQINTNYQGVQANLQRQNVDRGFGRSGTTATNAQTTELARQSDLGSLASRFAGYQLDQQNKTIDQAQKYAFADPGSDTKTVGAGNAAASGLGYLAGSLSNMDFSSGGSDSSDADTAFV